MEIKLPKWPENKSDNPHEFDDSSDYYKSVGFNEAITVCISTFNEWLKEREPIVLPERKQVRYENQERVQAFGDGEAKVTNSRIFYDREAEEWNSCLDEFLRLNPQINRKEP